MTRVAMCPDLPTDVTVACVRGDTNSVILLAPDATAEELVRDLPVVLMQALFRAGEDATAEAVGRTLLESVADSLARRGTGADDAPATVRHLTPVDPT